MDVKFPTKEPRMKPELRDVSDLAITPGPIHAGRQIITLDGQPAIVTLTMRPATTAPGRVKCALVIVIADKLGAQMPFAGVGGKLTPEFRLEMN